MFDSRHIRTFHVVVNAGTYSKAASLLGYTQPAVTQQMKALERSVGSPLFVRVGRRMRLTEAGETLARHAEAILESLDLAEERVTAITRLRSGTVRVYGFPSANATLVPEALAHLSAEHPGIRVSLLDDEPPDSLGRLGRGECDVTLAFTYPGASDELPEDVVAVPLMEDQLTVLMPVAHPRARRRSVCLADFSGERWIAGCARCRTHFLHACAELGFAPDIAYTTDDGLVVQSLVAQGLGLALVPSLVLPFLRLDRVAGRALRPAVHRRISAYVLRGHLRVPATVRVVEALRTVTERRIGC
ncbi:LysR substrate-binding domain-containing protein [Streptomyces coelicoflavus]|uniref:LysR substrate-binding domain-containing protein n=1 Tax=Streptomyces coelicoflavus TaxID=285562 RepID=UPI0024AD963A|nr:LysR family transcriptional regulator [Streptomyces coelicoflavus]MDI6521610.1 LysR substrate-binding domain-containing protein [Streptomyces coelicoflavus]